MPSLRLCSATILWYTRIHTSFVGLTAPATPKASSHGYVAGANDHRTATLRWIYPGRGDTRLARWNRPARGWPTGCRSSNDMAVCWFARSGCRCGASAMDRSHHACRAACGAGSHCFVLCAGVRRGAARAAWADPAYDPHAISQLPTKTVLSLRGEVAAEPDIRGGPRYLLIDVSAARLDGGQTWRQASGRAEVSVSGPNDWFAPAYGDTLTVKGYWPMHYRAR